MEMARKKNMQREEATRLMRATASFQCTYCDKHYNHSQESALTSRSNGTVRTLEPYPHVTLVLKLAEITRIFTILVLPVATDVR